MQNGAHVGLAKSQPTSGRSTAERLAARTRRVAGDGAACWLIQGHATRSGHVQIVDDSGVPVYAHRLAWTLANGPIPDGLSVLHHCDVPRCINPSHLFLGTQAANVRDCSDKSRRCAFGRQKMQLTAVLDLRERFAAGESVAELAERFRLSRKHVLAVVSRTRWGWLGGMVERVRAVNVPVLGDIDAGLVTNPQQLIEQAETTQPSARALTRQPEAPHGC